MCVEYFYIGGVILFWILCPAIDAVLNGDCSYSVEKAWFCAILGVIWPVAVIPWMIYSINKFAVAWRKRRGPRKTNRH